MTNQEIDKRLALAIGYPADRVRNIHGWVQVWNHRGRDVHYDWTRFDHTAPAVIWPIAERFDCFPAKGEFLKDIWFAGQSLGRRFGTVCAASAVALAVINYFEGRK